MNTPLVSIIVPVYKAEEYLSSCIDSILRQSFGDFELILVNDGSKDRSLAICKEKALKDIRIKIIDQENQGVTVARSNGVKNSSGKYIVFVDSDDTLPEDSIETLVSESGDEFDIIIGSIHNNFPQNQIIDSVTYQTRCILANIFPGPVAKLYKRSLFDENVFLIPRNIVVGEDLLMNIRISFNCKNKVKLLTKSIYNYNRHSESSMATFRDSWEYEGLFYKYVLTSIPPKVKNLFLPMAVDKAMDSWSNFYGYNYRVPSDYKSTRFYQLLEKTIHASTINSIDRKLFYETKILQRIFLITYKRIKKTFLHHKTFKRNYILK